jgi:hypothetical protein
MSANKIRKRKRDRSRANRSTAGGKHVTVGKRIATDERGNGERPGEQDMSAVEEVAARNRIPRTRIFEEIRYGRLVAVKIGRLTRIRREDEATWRATLPIRQAAI